MNLKSYFAKDIKNKEALAHQCVEIANKAKFNTVNIPKVCKFAI